ncbi:MAG: efflux RND transporter permease subunit [Halothece sp.]
MSFNLSSWSIKRPVPTIVLFLVLGIVGIISFFRLGINDLPNVDIPIVQVTIARPGAAPSELETQVTQEVENAVAGLDNVDRISSTITQGTSTTTINFVLGTDINRAANDVRNAISQIRQDLPQDINEPIVKRVEFAGQSIMTYAVASPERSVKALSQLVDRDISQALLDVRGVAQINRLGGIDRAIRVDLDPARLKALGITAAQVNNQIRNFNVNLPAGRAEIGSSEQTIRTLGSAETVEQLKSYRIALPNGDTVPLSNLGDIQDSVAQARQAALFNGEPVVAFSVRRSTGSVLVTVEEQVRQAVEKLQNRLPEDIQLNLIFTRADSIRASYRSTLKALLLGCILTVITVGIFLRNWRATIITAIALPLSLIPTFAVMGALDYTLNQMTLLALALAVGNLIDDAIAMNENIDKHLQRGKKPLQAARDGAQEISLAVVATTGTIVGVFLPVAFMGGVPGQFFQPFGITVAAATIFSTLVAIMITPLLSAYFLKSKHSEQTDNRSSLNGNASNGNRPSQRFQPYRSLLNTALRHRMTTLLIALAWFIGSLQLVPYLPKGLTAESDRGLSTLQVELPPGSTLSETKTVLQQVNRIFRESPAVKSVLATAREVNAATVYANLVPQADRTLSQQEFEEKMRQPLQKIPGARLSFRSQGAGGGSKDLSIILKSDNPEVLHQTANSLEDQMRKLPGLVDVTSSRDLIKPEITIIPNPDRAADLGVSVRDIAQTASIATIGDIEANLAKFNLPNRQIPIIVQLAPKYENDISTLKNLRVPAQDGTLIPLTAAADIRLGSGPAKIKRRDRQRQVTLAANLQGISLGQARAKIKELPAMNPLPPQVTQEPSGNAEIQQEIFSRFLSALGLGVLSIYAILVLLYNNFLYPLTILAALPLSVGGALLALLITQKLLGLYALIGMVLLMGLVTKNAILLVDFVLSNEEKGKPQFYSIVEAGMSRLRPIAMTAVSTIAGMIPIALELGAAGEVRSPMAITVIGGYSTSTLLTLVVVPVLFSLIDHFNYRLLRFFGGSASQRDRQESSADETDNLEDGIVAADHRTNSQN